MGNVLRRGNCKKPSDAANAAPPTPADLSDAAVRRVVDAFLRNPDVNQTYLPDAIERRLYYNVIKLFLGVLSESLKHARVELLGHQIVLHMDPMALSPPAAAAAVLPVPAPAAPAATPKSFHI
jgi:hypothetical protein